MGLVRLLLRGGGGRGESGGSAGVGARQIFGGGGLKFGRRYGIIRNMIFRRLGFIVATMSVAVIMYGAEQQPGVSPGPGGRYATDMYPGFDTEGDALSPEKKEPRLFAWWNGPEKGNASEQFAWAEGLAAGGEWSKAVKAYDALVREWPAAKEAVVAQKAMADALLEHEQDYEEAFKEYQYLLDFYSLECDYDAISEQMYKVANLMRKEGKTIVFFRFANTVDVRRAYEAVVLRSPGAAFIPEALLTIAELRVEEEKNKEAVTVYENLRNLYPKSEEALRSWVKEARVRMAILGEAGYNRERVRDTIGFMKMALKAKLDDGERAEVQVFLATLEGDLEMEAYKAAKFYDSRTRTVRSAKSAYEKYLQEYPAGAHADEVRARLEELKAK